MTRNPLPPLEHDESDYDHDPMTSVNVHIIPLLFGLLILAAIVWLVFYGVRRYHRHLHRHM
jgi:hypothetical protein